MPTLLHLTLSLLLMGVTVCAGAQTMYRCGSTYSQTPCGAGQKEIEVKADDPCELEGNKYSSTCIMRPSKPYSSKPSAAEEKRYAADKKRIDESHEWNRKALARINQAIPDPALVEENKKTCIASVTAMLKDPESARFGKAIRMGAELDPRDGMLIPSVMYTVMVNAKNSYGGYTGSKPYLCVFSADEKQFTRAWSPS